MPSTTRPATLWLNSDHARSASVRGAVGSPTGMSAMRGEASVGGFGVTRPSTSAKLARSVTTSTAGGSEVSEAATNRTVAPSPNSTSTNRRRRSGATSAASGSRRTAKKFSAPNRISPTRIAALLPTMRPYDVPSSARGPSTYARASPPPAATSTATAASAVAENRLSSGAGHGGALRPQARTRSWARPPIQTPAASWWSASSASSRARGPTLAAAWLVHAAASTSPATATSWSSQPAPARRRRTAPPMSNSAQARTRTTAARK